MLSESGLSNRKKVTEFSMEKWEEKYKIWKMESIQVRNIVESVKESLSKIINIQRPEILIHKREIIDKVIHLTNLSKTSHKKIKKLSRLIKRGLKKVCLHIEIFTKENRGSFIKDDLSNLEEKEFQSIIQGFQKQKEEFSDILLDTKFSKSMLNNLKDRLIGLEKNILSIIKEEVYNNNKKNNDFKEEEFRKKTEIISEINENQEKNDDEKIGFSSEIKRKEFEKIEKREIKLETLTFHNEEIERSISIILEANNGNNSVLDFVLEDSNTCGINYIKTEHKIGIEQVKGLEMSGGYVNRVIVENKIEPKSFENIRRFEKEIKEKNINTININLKNEGNVFDGELNIFSIKNPNEKGIITLINEKKLLNKEKKKRKMNSKKRKHVKLNGFKGKYQLSNKKERITKLLILVERSKSKRTKTKRRLKIRKRFVKTQCVSNSLMENMNKDKLSNNHKNVNQRLRQNEVSPSVLEIIKNKEENLNEIKKVKRSSICSITEEINYNSDNEVHIKSNGNAEEKIETEVLDLSKSNFEKQKNSLKNKNKGSLVNLIKSWWTQRKPRNNIISSKESYTDDINPLVKEDEYILKLQIENYRTENKKTTVDKYPYKQDEESGNGDDSIDNNHQKNKEIVLSERYQKPKCQSEHSIDLSNRSKKIIQKSKNDTSALSYTEKNGEIKKNLNQEICQKSSNSQDKNLNGNNVIRKTVADNERKIRLVDKISNHHYENDKNNDINNQNIICVECDEAKTIYTKQKGIDVYNQIEMENVEKGGIEELKISPKIIPELRRKAKLKNTINIVREEKTYQNQSHTIKEIITEKALEKNKTDGDLDVSKNECNEKEDQNKEIIDAQLIETYPIERLKENKLNLRRKLHDEFRDKNCRRSQSVNLSAKQDIIVKEIDCINQRRRENLLKTKTMTLNDKDYIKKYTLELKTDSTSSKSQENRNQDTIYHIKSITKNQDNFNQFSLQAKPKVMKTDAEIVYENILKTQLNNGNYCEVIKVNRLNSELQSSEIASESRRNIWKNPTKPEILNTKDKLNKNVEDIDKTRNIEIMMEKNIKMRKEKTEVTTRKKRSQTVYSQNLSDMHTNVKLIVAPERIETKERRVKEAYKEENIINKIDNSLLKECDAKLNVKSIGKCVSMIEKNMLKKTCGCCVKKSNNEMTSDEFTKEVHRIETSSKEENIFKEIISDDDQNKKQMKKITREQENRLQLLELQKKFSKKDYEENVHQKYMIRMVEKKNREQEYFTIENLEKDNTEISKNSISLYTKIDYNKTDRNKEFKGDENKEERIISLKEEKKYSLQLQPKKRFYQVNSALNFTTEKLLHQEKTSKTNLRRHKTINLDIELWGIDNINNHDDYKMGYESDNAERLKHKNHYFLNIKNETKESINEHKLTKDQLQKRKALRLKYLKHLENERILSKKKLENDERHKEELRLSKRYTVVDEIEIKEKEIHLKEKVMKHNSNKDDKINNKEFYKYDRGDIEEDILKISFQRIIEKQDTSSIKYELEKNGTLGKNISSCEIGSLEKLKIENKKNDINNLKWKNTFKTENIIVDQSNLKNIIFKLNRNNSNKRNKKSIQEDDKAIDKREKCHDIYKKKNDNITEEKSKIFNTKKKDEITEILEIETDEIKSDLNNKLLKKDEHIVSKNFKPKLSCCGGTSVKKNEIEQPSYQTDVTMESIESQNDSEVGSLNNDDYLDLSEKLHLDLSDKIESQSRKLEEVEAKSIEVNTKEIKKKKLEKPKYDYFEDELMQIANTINVIEQKTSLIAHKSTDSIGCVSYKQDLTDNDFPINKEDPENPKYWPTYVYRIYKENSSKHIVACVLRARVGCIGEQKNLECLVISPDRTLPNIDLCEDAASIAFELRPTSENIKFKFDTPWKILIPHILPKSTPKEPVILALSENAESWVELPTSEASADELKEHKMRFVEAKIEVPFGIFIVQTKTKVEAGVINKHGARITSSIDSRVFVSVPADAIRITLNTTLKINPIDNNFWKELKLKSEKSALDQVICSSHLIDFTTKKKKLIKPANISCFLPLNPEIKKQNEALSKVVPPKIKSYSIEDDEEGLTEKQSRTDTQKIDLSPFQKSLLMTGITGANANESIQVVCNSIEEDKWFPLENVQISTDKSKEQISMELPILQSIRCFMVRANRNISVENLAKGMRLIESELSIRNSLIILMKSTKDPNQFALSICLRSRSERSISQLIDAGFQTELQNASISVELIERQIITAKFTGNISNENYDRNVLKFTYQSLFQINCKFRVLEIDSYAQRAIDHYRGYLQIFARKLVKRPMEVLDQKNKKGHIQYHWVEEDVMVGQLLISVPKKKLVHYKPFRDVIFNRNILEGYMTLFATIAEGIRVSWRDLGTALNISESRMQSIRHHNNAHQFERMLVQMLIFWLKGLEMIENKPEILIKALYEINRTDLINRIKRLIAEESGSLSDSII